MKYMTMVEKQKITNFLDLTDDFLGSGYKSAPKGYRFDDKTSNSDEIQINSYIENDSLEQVAKDISECKNCKLCNGRKNTVPGEGAQNPIVMVIGEGPGAEEDALGRPFVGRAGQLLDQMLLSIKLSRNTDSFIANVVKCRPPNNRDPHPEETSACAGFLERQIMILKPKFILAAGRIAAQTLLQTSDSISKMRQKFHELKINGESFRMICTYHPSALLRDESYKRPAWEDLKLLKSCIDEAN